jgi:2-dehydro-3-deoxygluconokinase
LFYLETGASQRPSKVIYDRTESAITEIRAEDFDWDEIFRAKDWFHFSGTAPALGDNVAEVVAQACASARSAGLGVSCDLNYRKKLWSPEKAKEVMAGLMKNVDVIVGNEEDAEKVFGISAEGVDVTAAQIDVVKYESVLKELFNRFSLKYAALTIRESISASDNNWSGVLFDGRKIYFSRKYPIRIVDRVGGGDSFSAGLLYGLFNGMDPQPMLEFAVAASCLKHTIHGDLNLVSLEEVLALMGGDASGRVQR